MDNQQHSCRLNVRSLAIAGAILTGACLFLTALLASWGVIGSELVELAATIYPGYAVGFGGAVIGLFYGAVEGAIVGGLVAWLYNKFSKSSQ